MIKRAEWRSLGVYVLVFFLVLAVLHGGSRYMAVQDLSRQARIELEGLILKLSIELDKYRSTPKLLATHPLLAETLQLPDPSATRGANLLLERFNRDLGSDALYLINGQGIAVASSNWRSPRSFVGADYSFRPYFQQAANGELGSYFALGTRSQKRGYYFSAPVQAEGKILGVLTIKVSLSVIEHSWKTPHFHYLITDNNGVIFYSSNDSWHYHALVPLPDSVKERLIFQRQFGSEGFIPLFAGLELPELEKKSEVHFPEQGSSVAYLQEHRAMPEAGWKVFVLAPLSTIYPTLFRTTLIACFIGLLLFLIWLYWHRTVAAKQALAAINSELEHRVKQRTLELTRSNDELLETISMYRKAEAALERTQAELVQAAKLATLGEMSAGITHELNQPLCAARIYAENACKFLEKRSYAAAEENLREIISLNQMMAEIVDQLKIFSRKAVNKTEAVCLTAQLRSAVEILQNQITKRNVQIEFGALDELCFIDVDPVKFKQVLVNLLSNALHAVADVSSPRIGINLRVNNAKAHIAVWDNGIGFDKDQFKHLFDPFYTTRKQGLGLGLTISKRIIDLFHGELQACNRAEGGSVFTVILPSHRQEEARESSHSDSDHDHR